MDNLKNIEEEKLKELLKGHENPFLTPNSYFENLSDSIIQRVYAQPDFNVKAATSPFAVPDGYFENLSSQISNKVIASKTLRRPFWLSNIFRPAFSIPIAFASIIFIASLLYLSQNKNIPITDQEITLEDFNESDYLQNIDESVFVDLITFDNTNTKDDSIVEYLLENEIDVVQLVNEL